MKNNLKEEIERIKKLFTEERLYGNLINEQPFATDTNSPPDGIDAEEAVSFLKSQDYFVKKGAAVEKNVQDICYQKSNMKKIYNEIKSYNSGSISNDGKIMSNFSSNGGICFYFIKNTRLIPDGTCKLQRINFWDDGDGDFYLKLPYEINLSSVSGLTGTLPSATAGLQLIAGKNSTFNITKKIRYVKYSFKYDYGSSDYSNVNVSGYYNSIGFKKVKGIDTELTDSINNGYEPLSDMSDPTSAKLYTDITNTTTLVNSTNGLGMPAPDGTLNDLLSKI
jgi:hypothetical protein